MSNCSNLIRKGRLPMKKAMDFPLLRCLELCPLKKTFSSNHKRNILFLWQGIVLLDDNLYPTSYVSSKHFISQLFFNGFSYSSRDFKGGVRGNQYACTNTGGGEVSEILLWICKNTGFLFCKMQGANCWPAYNSPLA